MQYIHATYRKTCLLIPSLYDTAFAHLAHTLRSHLYIHPLPRRVLRAAARSARSSAAPPRALDDEESNFLQGVEAQRLEARERKDKWEAEELRGFALARANQTGTGWCVCLCCFLNTPEYLLPCVCVFFFFPCFWIFYYKRGWMFM